MSDRQNEPTARRRLDRLNETARHAQAKSIPTKTALAPLGADVPVAILVVPRCVDGRLSFADLQVIGLARQVLETHFPGSALGVVTFGAVSGGLSDAGADRVYQFPAVDDDSCCEVRAQSISHLIREVQPKHILVAAQEGAERGVVLRLSTLVEKGFAPKVSHVSCGDLTARSKVAMPGKALAQPLPFLSEILPGCGEPWNGQVRGIISQDMELAEVDIDVKELGQDTSQAGGAPLAQAEFVVSAGNGVRDLALFEDFVAQLRATPGASRVLVDAGKAARERQVGSSGTVVEARVYVAMGISGAPQHLLGIEACDYVIAVNTDPNCAMVRRADLAIIADAGDVMKAVVGAEYSKGGTND